MSFKQFLKESEYTIYHNTYTSAVEEISKYASKKNLTLDSEEMATEIGTGPAKPKEGKTNKFSLSIFDKNNKLLKKKLQVQIFNRGTSSNEFELNMYIL